MVEMKFTKQGMPIVSDETARRLYKNGKSWVEQLGRTREAIINEDPNLLEYMNRQVGGYSPEIRDKIYQELVGLYRVLEMQSEENKSNSFRELIIGKQ